jgi:UDP-N-acetylglucosamine transferase subunit ALG13
MEAYTMAAQAQQNFPLSALFRILNLDGKDKILPVIEENEHYQEMMMQMQQQMEQMGAQIEDLQARNENLQKTSTTLSNSLARVAPGSSVDKEQANPAAVVNQARNMMGQQTGQELPT